MASETDGARRQFWILGIYGVLLGAFFPSLAYFFAEIGVFGTPLGTLQTDKHVGLSFAALFPPLIVFVFIFLAGGLYQKHKVWASGLLWVAGVVAAVGLFFIVEFTGGSMVSPFSGYYIYTPSVVAIITRGRVAPIMLASLFSGAAFVLGMWVNVYGVGPQLTQIPGWSHAISGSWYQGVYLFVFICQLGATVLVARESFK